MLDIRKHEKNYSQWHDNWFRYIKMTTYSIHTSELTSSVCVSSTFSSSIIDALTLFILSCAWTQQRMYVNIKWRTEIPTQQMFKKQHWGNDEWVRELMNHGLVKPEQSCMYLTLIMDFQRLEICQQQVSRSLCISTYWHFSWYPVFSQWIKLNYMS